MTQCWSKHGVSLTHNAGMMVRCARQVGHAGPHRGGLPLHEWPRRRATPAKVAVPHDSEHCGKCFTIHDGPCAPEVGGPRNPCEKVGHEKHEAAFCPEVGGVPDGR